MLDFPLKFLGVASESVEMQMKHFSLIKILIIKSNMFEE